MVQGSAFAGGEASAVRWFAQQPSWWESHYLQAVDQVVEFLEGDALTISGRRVLDLGCGDGIISLGLANRTEAASVIGLDLHQVDTAFLATQAEVHGVPTLSTRLRFEVSEESCLHLDDQSVDLVVAWSVFEHVTDIHGILAELRRVLVPDGLLFIQIWPLFFSEHGSHLWPWFDRPFPHLVLEDEDLRARVLERTGSNELGDAMLDLYGSCNRLTLDELGAALSEGGFFVAKVEVDRTSVHVPPELQRMPLSLLTASGVKLIAINQRVSSRFT